MDKTKPRIGVLAIQGDYAAHAAAVEAAGGAAEMVRAKDALAGLDGLIMPGGESTTMLKFLERDEFFEALREFMATTPTFGTCAGCILMAKDVQIPPQRSLAVLDIAVERNAYGRQNDSTILSAETMLPGGPLEMVFIRAPRIVSVGDGVQVLAERDGFPALVRQEHLMAATFHPEMTADARVHELFLDVVRSRRA